MTETRRLKNVVIFVQTISTFITINNMTFSCNYFFCEFKSYLHYLASFKALFKDHILACDALWKGDFFKKLGFTPCKTEQPLRAMELQEKRITKSLKQTENLLKKNIQLKDLC